MEEERGIPREKMIDAIVNHSPPAYKKNSGSVVKSSAESDMETGTTNFNQVKIVVDESMLKSQNQS